jgi:hypothetical protein
MFDSNDLKYYLSGGTANRSPDLSLGGSISTEPVNDLTGNLFSQITKTQAESGSTTYRCMYVVNEGDETLYNVEVYVDQEDAISTLYIGLHKQIEVQKIILTGSPIGGTFRLRYLINIDGIQVSQETNDIQFIPDLTQVASNVQTALNDLTYLSDVSVVAQYVDSAWVFMVTFNGTHAYREHKQLQIATNNVLGENIGLVIQTVTEGGPVNTTAVDIGFENQAPTGINFNLHTADDTLAVGTLFPLDGFAIWLKRVTESDTIGTTEDIDNAVLKIAAQVEV